MTGAAEAPVPVSATVCGLLGASSAKESAALRAPVAPGVNVTLTVQVAFTARACPEQVSAVLAKSLAFAPVGVTEVMCRMAPPLFVTVTDWATLDVDTV